MSFQMVPFYPCKQVPRHRIPPETMECLELRARIL